MHRPIAQRVTNEILSLESTVEVLPMGKNLWAFRRQPETTRLKGASLSNPSVAATLWF